MIEMASTKGNTRKTPGEPLCLWTACGFLVDATGAVVRGGEETGGDRKREKGIQRPKEGVGVGRGGESVTAPSAV